VQIQCNGFRDSNTKGLFTNPDKQKKDNLNLKKICSALTYDKENNVYTVAQIRDLDLYLRILESTEDKEVRNMAEIQLYSTFKDIDTNIGNSGESNGWANSLGISSNKISFWEIEKDKARQFPYEGLKDPDGRPIQYLFTSKGDKYKLILDDSSGKDELPILRGKNNSLEIYDDRGNKITDETIQESFINVYFKRFKESSYQNKFQNPEVRYYESGAYQGDPAIVPFQLDEGWYVAMKPGLPILGNIGSFDKSGRVKNFHLCNVGPDKRAELFLFGGR